MVTFYSLWKQLHSVLKLEKKVTGNFSLKYGDMRDMPPACDKTNAKLRCTCVEIMLWIMDRRSFLPTYQALAGKQR